MFYVVYSEVSEEFSFEFEFHFVEESFLIHLRQKTVKYALAVSSEHVHVFLCSYWLLSFIKRLFLVFAGIFCNAYMC